ncbi:MAG: glutamate racemase [bacterium]
MSDLRPIGIFDSGVGGITVVKEIFRRLPRERLVYLGDSAHTPYGPRSKENIIKLSLNNARFLISQDVKMIVIACNTASSHAAEIIRKKFPHIPVIDVIKPCARRAASCSSKSIIAVIGTQGTIDSQVYKYAIEKINKRIQIISKACPLFVPLVEEGITDISLKHHIIKYYLEELKENGINTIILGCTHYPLIRNEIKKYWGDRTLRILDSATWTVKDVAETLKANRMGNSFKRPLSAADHRYYVTDDPVKFIRVGSRFLGRKIQKAEKVEL